MGQLLLKTDYANINKPKEGREMAGLPPSKFILSTEAGTEMTSLESLKQQLEKHVLPDKLASKESRKGDKEV